MFTSIKVHKLLKESVPDGRGAEAATYYRQAKKALSMTGKKLSPAQAAGFTLVSMVRLDALEYDELTSTGQSLYRIAEKMMPNRQEPE